MVSEIEPELGVRKPGFGPVSQPRLPVHVSPASPFAWRGREA